MTHEQKLDRVLLYESWFVEYAERHGEQAAITEAKLMLDGTANYLTHTCGHRAGVECVLTLSDRMVVGLMVTSEPAITPIDHKFSKTPAPPTLPPPPPNSVWRLGQRLANRLRTAKGKTNG